MIVNYANRNFLKRLKGDNRGLTKSSFQNLEKVSDWLVGAKHRF